MCIYMNLFLLKKVCVVIVNVCWILVMYEIVLVWVCRCNWLWRDFRDSLFLVMGYFVVFMLFMCKMFFISSFIFCFLFFGGFISFFFIKILVFVSVSCFFVVIFVFISICMLLIYELLFIFRNVDVVLFIIWFVFI